VTSISRSGSVRSEQQRASAQKTWRHSGRAEIGLGLRCSVGRVSLRIHSLPRASPQARRYPISSLVMTRGLNTLRPLPLLSFWSGHIRGCDLICGSARPNSARGSFGRSWGLRAGTRIATRLKDRRAEDQGADEEKDSAVPESTGAPQEIEDLALATGDRPTGLI